MDKLFVVYQHNGILYIPICPYTHCDETKWYTVICNIVIESHDRILSQRSQIKREHSVWFQTYKGQHLEKPIYSDGCQDSGWAGHGVGPGRARGTSCSCSSWCISWSECAGFVKVQLYTNDLCIFLYVFVLYSGVLANLLSRKKKKEKKFLISGGVCQFLRFKTPIMMDFRLATND